MTGTLTVLPLGPGTSEFLTLGSADLLRTAKSIILRTDKHPVSDWLRDNGVSYSSLDHLYEDCNDFDELNSRIVRTIIESAQNDDTVYAVPDPLMDRTVSIISGIAEQEGLRYILYPGVSSAAALISSGRINGTDGISLISASSLVTGYNKIINFPLLILEIDTRLTASEVKLVLSRYLKDQADIQFFLPSSSFPRKHTKITLCEIDRQNGYDQTTAVFIPSQPENEILQLSGRQILAMISAGKTGSDYRVSPAHEYFSSLMSVSADKLSNFARIHDYNRMSKELATMLKLVYQQIEAGEISGNITLDDVNDALLQHIKLQR